MDLLHGYAKRDDQDKLAEGLFEKDDFRGDSQPANITSYNIESHFEA